MDVAEDKRKRGTWCNKWNVQLGRELLLVRPYAFKSGTTESAAAWGEVTANMAKLDGFIFGTKAVRDHYATMQKKRRAEVNAEKKLSGVNIELSELQVLLDEIHDDTEKEKELQTAQDDGKRAKDEAEKAKAEEVRQKAMETHSQTKKRRSGEGKDGDDIPGPSPKRRSGSETLRFLMEKNDFARQEHDDTMKLRKEELELQKQQFALQQQQQQQQFQLQQQQMLQQSQLFAALIDKLSKN